MKKILKILLILLAIYFLLYFIGTIFDISTVPSLGTLIEDIKNLFVPKSSNPFVDLAPLSK